MGFPGHAVQAQTLFEPANILGAAWAELNSAGEIRDPVWHRLIEGYPDLDRMRNLIEVPREQRVQAIDVALRMLLSSKRGDEERRGFLAGYFTSLLGPGTLDHADFLAPVVTAFPTAYLWYGLFAGANPRGDALPTGNPLARRIVRDLTIPDRLVDRPRCDVALEELAMHAAVENLLRQTAKAGRLDIDILPGVTMSVRWPPHDGLGEDESRRQPETRRRSICSWRSRRLICGLARWLNDSARFYASAKQSASSLAKGRRAGSPEATHWKHFPTANLAARS